jgi:hypothetical protein
MGDEAMKTEQPDATLPVFRWARPLARRADTYGLVLLLIVVDYIAVSTLLNDPWGRVVIDVALGATLLFTLRTSRSRLIWQLLALFYLLTSAFSSIASALAPGTEAVSRWTTGIGGLLLIVTPFVILRRISAHRVVTTETVLGAICVYLLIGFSFAFIYATVGALSGAAFFEGQTNAPFNDYLFFSYTTLTTVGYGNLVPASAVGQTLAMLEALSGQIYLVIVVARLVSLWGQALPLSERPQRRRAAISRGAGAEAGEGDAGDSQEAGERGVT